MDEFLELLERRAGRSLRVVSWYDETDHGIWYVREDLDRAIVEDRMAFLSERLVDGGPVLEPSLEALGPEQAMVQIREQAVILRFPMGDRQGIVVSLDIEAARNLHSFVVECAERLGGMDFEGVAESID